MSGGAGKGGGEESGRGHFTWKEGLWIPDSMDSTNDSFYEQRRDGRIIYEAHETEIHFEYNTLQTNQSSPLPKIYSHHHISSIQQTLNTRRQKNLNQKPKMSRLWDSTYSTWHSSFAQYSSYGIQRFSICDHSVHVMRQGLE